MIYQACAVHMRGRIPASICYICYRPAKLTAAGSPSTGAAVRSRSAAPLLPAPSEALQLAPNASSETSNTIAGEALAGRRGFGAVGGIANDGDLDAAAGAGTQKVADAAAGAASANRAVPSWESRAPGEGSLEAKGPIAGNVDDEGGPGQRQKSVKPKPVTPRDKGQRSMQSFFARKS